MSIKEVVTVVIVILVSSVLIYIALDNQKIINNPLESPTETIDIMDAG
jgi:hypothetical protein